jgi:hypothetical protein
LLPAQIWQEVAPHHFRDVPADAAFLLGQTAPVNRAAPRWSGSCDVTNLHVAKKPRNLLSLGVQVKPRFCHSLAPTSLGANALQHSRRTRNDAPYRIG